MSWLCCRKLPIPPYVLGGIELLPIMFASQDFLIAESLAPIQLKSRVARKWFPRLQSAHTTIEVNSHVRQI